MKNHISLWAICLLATALFLLPQAAQAQCTLASLTGTYQFNEAAVPFILPFVAEDSVGTLTADGAGNFTFTDTAWGLTLGGFVSGGLLPIPGTKILSESIYAGSYQVNPNCTMSMTFHSSNNNCFTGNCFFPIHFQAVIVKGGTAFFMIDNDPGLMGSGVGVKI